MPSLILKSPYLKPNKAKHIGNHVKYIATRDGVVMAPDTSQNLPATAKQKELIEEILKIQPDAKDLHEHYDYLHSPTRRNASEFILRACEVYAATFGNREKYLSYIGERPGVEKIGANGLFSDKGVPIVMSKIQEEIANSHSNVWTHIISLKREDAERLGYNTVDAWMQLLRAHRQDFCKNMRIDPENFRWYAAFHNEGHHPHVHMMAYSIKPKEAYLTKKGIDAIRSALAKDIFADDRLNIYTSQTEHRENLKTDASVKIRHLISKINSGEATDEVINTKLQNLAQMLSKTKGKKVYGYLKAPVKQLIDSIVDDLEKTDKIAELYNLWYEEREKILRQYTDTLPKRIPLSQNKEFKSIKNMVIHEALSILFDGETAAEISKYDELKDDAENGNSDAQLKLSRILNNPDSERYNPADALRLLRASAESGNANAQYLLGKMYLFGTDVKKDYQIAREYLESSSEQGNQYAEQLLYTVDHERTNFAALGALSLVRYTGSVIQNKTEDNKGASPKAKHITDKKTKQKEREKKESQGMYQTM